MKYRLVIASVVLATILGGCSSSGHGGTEPSTGSGNAVYPPTTMSQAKALAHSGDPTALHLVKTINRPFRNCERPNYYATADPGLSGRTLAADELAFFTAHYSLDNQCAAYLYVFAHAAEVDQPGYTVGAVLFDESGLEVHTSAIGSAPAFTVH